jgi:hypothetical protein
MEPINREIIMKNTIRFTVNGRPTTLQVDEDRMLLWILRTELGLTGTKYGCGEGLCGSCTVLIDAQDSPPQGGGEPAIIGIGAMIANGIFDAVGARVLRMPMTPARVRRAVEEARQSPDATHHG